MKLLALSWSSTSAPLLEDVGSGTPCDGPEASCV
eukprot:CAMPEP_0172726432 /NCGR_PEP_ID=MMETSP1074-20121228/90684_1 /TAXON_ID=2916 /ORGANISM="Ceratium fusus, Strain PA161109" /LENGTH=33 /DNA_ID= /DNA_START= /DNA_END= /DNA_ORIENTATION=